MHTKIIKRIGALALSAALLCSLIVTPSFAAPNEIISSDEGITFSDASSAEATLAAAATKNNLGLDFDGSSLTYGNLHTLYLVESDQPVANFVVQKPNNSLLEDFPGFDDQYPGYQPCYYAAIVDMSESGTPSGEVYFYPTTVQDTQVEVSIPVSEHGTAFALVQSFLDAGELVFTPQVSSIQENSSRKTYTVEYDGTFTMGPVSASKIAEAYGWVDLAGSKFELELTLENPAISSLQVSGFQSEIMSITGTSGKTVTFEFKSTWKDGCVDSEGGVNKDQLIEKLKKEMTISFSVELPAENFEGGHVLPLNGKLYTSALEGVAATTFISFSKDNDFLQMTPAVTLVPEDITIYSGGVGGDDANPEFPHPIYLKMNSDKTTENADQMTFKIDGSDATYHADDLFTVKYYDNAGHEITADSTYGDYTAKIVVKDQFQGKTILTSEGSLPVSFGTGTLRIRYVSSFTDASENALTAIAQQYDNSAENNKQAAAIEVEKTDKAGILLDEDATIYLNGNTKYPYPAGFTSGIALLFDDLLPTHSGGDNSTYKDALVKHAADKGFDISGMNTQFQYLDLVDTNDSNAWVSSSQGVDVFWPYPSGVDANTSLTLLHFTGLHREYAMPGQDTLPEQIADAGVESVSFTRGNGGIWFHIDQNGFSPFALVWETTSVDPDPGDGGGTGTRDDYTLHYVTNGGKHLSSETKSSAWTKDYEDLPIPVRDGYTFEGWYWDLRLTEPVTGDVKVNKTTVTLYAKWSGGNYGPDDTGVSKWLETDQHNAFLSGYPDGSFLADKNMTRAEVAQMFYSLLLDKDVKITKSFSDVPTDAWYAKAVNTLSSLGMLGGYPDGTFRPDAPITRAEFAAIALAFAYDPASASCSYTDVSTSAWYYTYVAQATTYGWIGGYPDGSFRPNNSITRAEVAVIVNNMLGRDADESYINRNADELVSFVDLSKNHWAYYTIMEATNPHDYTTSSNGESWK